MNITKLLFRFVLLGSLLFAALSQAGYLEVFEKEFMLNPWAGGRHEISACVECHSASTMGPEMHTLVEEWRNSWHSDNEVSCHDCHGGGPDDASMSMSHDRGFTGTPSHQEVPHQCGKCHIGILKNYLESGHGKSLLSTDSGPNCVTCHGSHDIKQASLNIINEALCTQCHSYERAKLMRQSLVTIENKLTAIQNDLQLLQTAGVVMADQNKAFFRAHSDFRTLFHTIDITLVNDKSDQFINRLNRIEAKTEAAFAKLNFRKNFSAALFLLFACMGLAAFFMIKSYDK